MGNHETDIIQYLIIWLTMQAAIEHVLENTVPCNFSLQVMFLGGNLKSKGVWHPFYHWPYNA